GPGFFATARQTTVSKLASLNNQFQNTAAAAIQAAPDLTGSRAVRLQTRLLLTTLRTSALRIMARAAWLAAELFLAAWVYPLYGMLRREGSRRAARARWLQRVCRRLLRVFEISCRITGTVPAQGLLVSNHLSYLDILVLGAVFPCVFVAKHEVRHW